MDPSTKGPHPRDLGEKGALQKWHSNKPGWRKLTEKEHALYMDQVNIIWATLDYTICQSHY